MRPQTVIAVIPSVDEMAESSWPVVLFQAVQMKTRQTDQSSEAQGRAALLYYVINQTCAAINSIYRIACL